MAEVADKYQNELQKIKKDVKNSYDAFKPNYDRFNEFRRFIFETSLNSDDISLLSEQGKPAIEFNITEAYISRLMGEFSKQEPSIAVGAADEKKADPQTISVVEAHMRYIMLDTKNYHWKWELMKDIYSGGFSVAKLWTDWSHPMSMDQDINIDRVFDPCLVGFDQMARHAHKGDGSYCFELYPYELEEFKEMNPKVRTDKITFNRAFAGFNWSYLNGNQKIMLVANYYKKKKRDVQILRLVNDEVMTVADYELMQEEWDRMGVIAQLPAVKGKTRWTQLETVCRYRCIETEVIEYKETDFTFYPLVFFDGNSIMIKNPKTSGANQQMTRPYVYHAKGAQKLKNYAGITLANEMENIVQSKFMIAKEALPKEMDFMDALTNIQKPSNIVFNAFFEQNPDYPINNPIMPVPRVPTPPEVVQTFASTDSLIQNILGSYDAALGINDNQLSGIAIVEAATQSNAAAMPYIVGFLQGLQRLAEIIVSLIPKYYTTPRTIPVLGKDNKQGYEKINQEGAVYMDYDVNVLNVKVEAGVSFSIQKNRALQQLIALMQASEQFNAYMNSKGLPVLLDNIEIRGIDQLKLSVEDWMAEQDKARQMQMEAQQQEMQNNPAALKTKVEMAKLQQEAQHDAMEASFKEKQLRLDYAELQQQEKKIQAEIKIAHEEAITQRIKAQSERFAKHVDLALKRKDMLHSHVRDAIELHHTIREANKPQPLSPRH